MQAVQLRRVLSVRDLVVYGIILITPVAPAGVFGVASQMSQGHAAATVLLAMTAMMFTAYSYGAMAAAYPSAGSAWVYVSRGLHPVAGFAAGWAMFLDYLIIPLINVLYIALAAQRVFPKMPLLFWAAVTTTLITALNVRGIRLAARVNDVLLVAMCAAIAVFMVAAVRWLAGAGALTWSAAANPFYDARTFAWTPVLAATSLATLTFIGFDGVTTLAEEVRDPVRSLPRATVLTCVFTGLLSTAQVWLAQMAWPDFRSFPNAETAFLDVTARVGGPVLFQAFGLILIVACFGSALAGQASASRLLYAMGRDGVLPRRLFGRLHPVTAVPAWNVVLLGALALAASAFVAWEHAVGVLNFGAFLSFLGVNAAAMRRMWPSLRAAFPLIGLLLCLLIWINLPRLAWIAGGAWCAAGIAVALWRARSLAALEFKES